MGGDSSFVSDRRNPANTTWNDGSDWNEGTTEGVDIVNGNLVGQTASEILYDEGVNEESWIKGATEGDFESPLGGTLTKEVDHLFVDAVSDPGSSNSVSWVYSNIIDFSGYTEVVIESASQENEGEVQMVLTPEVQLDYLNRKKLYSIRMDQTYSRQTDTYDVSDISGKYYLHLVARDPAVFTGWPSEAEFYYVGLR